MPLMTVLVEEAMRTVIKVFPLSSTAKPPSGLRKIDEALFARYTKANREFWAVQELLRPISEEEDPEDD